MGLAFGATAWKVMQNNHLELTYNRKLYGFIAVIFLSLIVSTIFSLSPVQSVYGHFENPQGMILLSLVLLHFFVCLRIFREKETIEIFFKIIKWITLFMCLHAIGQFFNIDPFLDVDNAEYLFRVYSTIGQPNFLGQFLIFPFFILLFEFDKKLSKKNLKKLLPSFLLFSLVLITIFLTKNRATWLALMFCSYFFLLRKIKIRVLYKWIFTILLFSVPIISFFTFDLVFRSFQVRLSLWQGALDIITVKNIWFGTGLETFQQGYLHVMPKEIFEYEQFYKTPSNVHNEFLHIFVERGLLGIFTYLLMIGFLLSSFWKKNKKNLSLAVPFALLAYMISVLFSFSTIEHLVFLAAFWAILINSVIHFSEKKINFRNPLFKIVILILLNLMMAFSFFGAYSLYKMDYELRQGIDVFITDLDKASHHFHEAADSSFFFSYPQEFTIKLLSRFYTGNQNEIDKLEKNLDRVAKINNENFIYHLTNLELAYLKNDRERFDQSYDQLLILTPHLPEVPTAAVDYYYEIGDCEAVIQSFNYLLQLVPSAYYLENSKDANERNEYRLFRKHATALFSAKSKYELCL